MMVNCGIFVRCIMGFVRWFCCTTINRKCPLWYHRNGLQFYREHTSLSLLLICKGLHGLAPSCTYISQTLSWIGSVTSMPSSNWRTTLTAGPNTCDLIIFIHENEWCCICTNHITNVNFANRDIHTARVSVKKIGSESLSPVAQTVDKGRQRDRYIDKNRYRQTDRQT